MLVGQVMPHDKTFGSTSSIASASTHALSMHGANSHELNKIVNSDELVHQHHV